MPIIILTAYDWSDIEAEAKEVGLEVDTAENGQAALNKVANASPGYYSLVLMDVMMPLMNGYEATKAICSLENPEQAAIPIIAITANAFEEDRLAAIQAGMTLEDTSIAG